MSASEPTWAADHSLTHAGAGGEVEPSGGPGSPLEVSRLFSAYRLQVARQARGMTKSELSKKLRVSAPAVSQFELGQARPSPATVKRLAEVLEFAPAFFSAASVMATTPEAADEVVDSFGHFRSLRSVTATKRREVLTIAHLLRDVTAYLETEVKLPELSVPHHRVDSRDAACDVAAKVRAELGVVDDGPIGDVLRILERHGVVCARYDFNASNVSAFSVPLESRAFLVLKSHRSAKLDRDRFSACHELGHLVMHEPGEGLASKELEREADAFASEFLMPAAVIRDELPSKVEWPALLQLKKRWGVSMAALLMRAKTLGVMPEATYVHAMRTMSMRGWRVEEPGAVAAVESPRLLSRAMNAVHITPPDISSATGWPVAMISELIAGSTDTRPAIDL